MNINGWRLDRASPIIKQNNSHDCGPLACLKIMDMFGTMKQTSINNDTREIRSMVIEEYKRLLTTAMKDLVLKEKKDDNQLSNSPKKKHFSGNSINYAKQENCSCGLC